MPGFAFRIEECTPSIEGSDGVVLAGPVLDEGRGIEVGDPIVVPTVHGPIVAECAAFVFPRWGAGREHWLTITATGVDFQVIAKGGVAHALG